MAVFWNTLMMETVITSETSVNFYQTIWHNIPDYSHLHIRRREHLKSHLGFMLFSRVLKI
jgi:hypothetical protein